MVTKVEASIQETRFPKRIFQKRKANTLKARKLPPKSESIYFSPTWAFDLNNSSYFLYFKELLKQWKRKPEEEKQKKQGYTIVMKQVENCIDACSDQRPNPIGKQKALKLLNKIHTCFSSTNQPKK